MLFFAVVFAGVNMPLFADIESSNTAPTCDYGTLAAYSGDVDLKAEYEANVIELHWYNQDTEIAVQAEAQTCTYDTTFPLPSEQPTRAGYQFGGWKVKTFDFATLTSLQNGAERWAIGLNNNVDYCLHLINVSCDSDNMFTELERHEWAALFDTGLLYGKGYCSAKSGNNTNTTWSTNSTSSWLSTYDQLEIVGGDKLNCWCQATGWKPSSNNASGRIYKRSSAFEYWVFVDSSRNESGCTQLCSWYCANRALSSYNFRRALFTISQ